MLLLDTHTFLWFVNDPTRLPEKVNTEIETAESVYVSIASFWEIRLCEIFSVNSGSSTIKPG